MPKPIDIEEEFVAILQAEIELEILRTFEPAQQKLIDEIITTFGPEELWRAAELLKSAAMKDIEDSFKQIAEDQENELAWLRKQ